MKAKILIGLMALSMSLFSQSRLSVPVTLINAGAVFTDNMFIEFTNWQNIGVLSAVDPTNGGVANGTAYFDISVGWNPTVNEFNELRAAGANTTDYAWFIQCDSTFFIDTVKMVAGSDIYKYIGRFTKERLQWGEFYGNTSEIYYDPSVVGTNKYYVKMQKDDGTLMTMLSSYKVRSKADGVTGIRPGQYVYLRRDNLSLNVKRINVW